jgi:hypothetical protein
MENLPIQDLKIKSLPKEEAIKTDGHNNTLSLLKDAFYYVQKVAYEESDDFAHDLWFSILNKLEENGLKPTELYSKDI